MSARETLDERARDAAHRSESGLSEAHGALPSTRLASVVGLDSSGRLLVVLEGDALQRALPALCATEDEISPKDTVAVTFVQADEARPVVIGKLRTPRFVETSEAGAKADDVVLEAGRQLVLRCGKSSLILTRAGKLLLRGAYVSTHSSGVNRIKGASVQIN